MVGRRLLDELGCEHPARHRRRQRAENVIEAPQATVDDDTDGAAAFGGDLTRRSPLRVPRRPGRRSFSRGASIIVW